MFDDKTIQAIVEKALKLELEPSVLLAVAEVESAGRLFVKINNRNEPLIRFEGHYFDRMLKGRQREHARRIGLSSPKAGKIKNSRNQSQRWKMLKRAIAINRTAALSSTSWGVGQVMGAHWNWLGYGSVDALVSKARSGVIGQVDLMARFIDCSDLIPALQNHDWVTFARRYNGPGYKRNSYDKKLQLAFQRISKARSVNWRNESTCSGADSGDGMSLQLGSTGREVRGLQAGLGDLGYLIAVDGLFGVETDRVVRQFQRNTGCAETGIADARTISILKGRRFPGSIRLKSTVIGFRKTAVSALHKANRHLFRNKPSSALTAALWLLSIFKRIAYSDTNGTHHVKTK